MTEDEALALARAAVTAKGGELSAGILARKHRRWIWFGRASWQIVSNWPKLGGNWWLTIDDETGEVRSIGFAPR